MQKCNHCGCVSKYNVERCPHCGSMDYIMVDNMSEYEVEIPPLDGYHSVPKPQKRGKVYFYVGIFFLIIVLMVQILNYEALVPKARWIVLGCWSTDYLIFLLGIIFINTEKLKDKFSLLKSKSHKPVQIREVIVFVILIMMFLLPYVVYVLTLSTIVLTILAPIPLILAILTTRIVSIYQNDMDASKNYKSLLKNGVLIKNIQYKLIRDKDNPELQKIKVEYITKNGVTIELISKQSYNDIPADDKNVDLLIDKSDFSNYYIDFEIL